jgi:hypothetical protein
MSGDAVKTDHQSNRKRNKPMKIMKSMMENMMPVVMKGISPEEKEDLMLKMMPMMMEDIDLAELLPRMMTTILPAMLPELLEFLSKDEAHA